jgi:gliding motility-associated lipoprotein GldH
MSKPLFYGMKGMLPALLITILMAGCDSQRLYEQNKDLEKSQWLVQDKPTFEFRIRDIGKQYNLLCNIRNSSTYPYARFFLNYSLKDSTGAILANDMASVMLFDPKSGKPNGASGIGDVFDHQLPLLANYQFTYVGRYTLELEQNMRLDTLQGIEAVGLRVEEAIVKK